MHLPLFERLPVASAKLVPMSVTSTLDREGVVRRGLHLEYFTVAWNALEGFVAVIAGAFAGSISLVGFGLDSFIEMTSGAALLWRMSVDADVKRRERNEQLALGLVGSRFGWLHHVRISDGFVVQEGP